MNIGESIQCQSCGASSLIKHDDLAVLECQYCGTMISITGNHQANSKKTKPLHLTLLLVMLPVIVVALLVIFWVVFQQTRDDQSIESLQPTHIQSTTSIVPTGIQYELSKQQQKSDEPIISLSDFLTIESQVAGETVNGGKYWVIAVKNTSEQTLARPGVMLSLFNKDGERIEEQGGWALREMLQPNEQTVVLLYLDEMPNDAVEQQINTFAKAPSHLGLKQVELTVLNYNVGTKYNQYELVGDVLNNHDFNVKYVRLVAVAYDAKGQAIGIGNAFSTDKDLVPQQRSGFKVKVGTFLQGEPVSWQVWALGKSENNPQP